MKSQYPEQDIFLWLKHPIIAEMRLLLKWAHKRALREDIRYREIRGGGAEKYPSDRQVEDIASHIDRNSKMFFRVIIRKGLNYFMALDDEKRADLLDIGIHCVRIAEKEYYVNCYLSSTLLGQLKRRFALTENLRQERAG